MDKVPNGAETLAKILTGLVGHTNVTDAGRKTDDDIASERGPAIAHSGNVVES